MAVPRFFTGTTAGRMEDIRRLRGTQAVRQTGRVLGAAAMGATRGSTAAAAWLDAHPVHTYDRDRQRFYEALAQGTDIMKTAVMREQQIARRNAQRMLSLLGAGENIMNQKAAASRTNAPLSHSTAARKAAYVANNSATELGNLMGNTPEFQEGMERLLLDQGLTPEQARSRMRQAQGGGGGGGGGLTSTMAGVYSSRFGTLSTLFPGGVQADAAGAQAVRDVRVNLNSGGMDLRDRNNNPVAASEVQTAYIIEHLMPGASLEDKMALARLITPGTDPEILKQNAKKAAEAGTSLGVSDPDKLTEGPGARHAALMLQAGGVGAGAGVGAGVGTGAGAGAGASSSDQTASYLVLRASDDDLAEFHQRNQSTPEEQETLNTQRDAIYSKAADVVQGTFQSIVTADESGYTQLIAAVQQVETLAQAMGLDPESLWKRARSSSPNPELAQMEWTAAVAKTNEILPAATQAAMQAPLDELDKVRYAGVDDSDVRDLMAAVEGSMETVRKTSGAAQHATRQAVGVPEADTGSEPNDQAQQSYEAGEGGVRADVEAEAQVPETPTFRPDETVTYYGLEIPASKIPDPQDYGAQVEFMWEMASSYPAHPPLQQAIRDQMASSEFKDWMESRGYIGQPTPQLFREFQREYRNVRRMNAIHNRRQAKMRRLAQERVGDRETPELTRPGEEEGRTEDDQFTRRRTREYRRETGEALRGLRRVAREDAQEERQEAREEQMKDVRDRIRERQKKRQERRGTRTRVQTPPRAALADVGMGVPNGE